MSNEYFQKVSSKSDIAIMSNLQIKTPKLVHYQAVSIASKSSHSWALSEYSYKYIVGLNSHAKKTSNRHSDLRNC